ERAEGKRVWGSDRLCEDGALQPRRIGSASADCQRQTHGAVATQDPLATGRQSISVASAQQCHDGVDSDRSILMVEIAGHVRRESVYSNATQSPQQSRQGFRGRATDELVKEFPRG